MAEVRPGPNVSLDRVITRARTRGASEVVALGVERSREWLWSSEQLIMLSAGTSSEDPSVPGLTIRRATPDDATEYAAQIGTDSTRTFRARLTGSTWCLLVVEGRRLLHASWVTERGAWTRELRRYVVPPRGSVYVYESFTAPSARGRGIYPAALRAIRAAAGERVDRVWVAVEGDNPASRRALDKAGFEPSFTIAYRRRFGRVRLRMPQPPPGERWPEITSRAPQRRPTA